MQQQPNLLQQWQTLIVGIALGAVISFIGFFGWNSDVAPPNVSDHNAAKDTHSALARMQDEISKLSGALASAVHRESPPKRKPSEQVTEPFDDLDEIASRLEAIETVLDGIGSQVMAHPPLSAMELDARHAPPRSHTDASVRAVAARLDADQKAAEELLLLPMQDVLQRFGKPDWIEGRKNGGTRWVWFNQGEFRLEATFHWGKLSALSGVIL